MMKDFNRKLERIALDLEDLVDESHNTENIRLLERAADYIRSLKLYTEWDD